MGVGDTGPKIRGFVLSVMVGRTARAQRSPLIISLKKLQCGDKNIFFGPEKFQNMISLAW